MPASIRQPTRCISDTLVPLLTLRRFQRAGHKPVALVGGATGLIGDPSFKDDERTLNSRDQVAAWVNALGVQMMRFLDSDGPLGAHLVNNLDWAGSMDVITYLRDIGKHFSVNAMIQRDAVRARLEREDRGISYTEFSYLLLQAMDFLELARRHNCSLQIGGSDQWGNMVSGTDLIRRHLQREAYAATLPLVTKSDGSKFGKTASGAVWLDAAKTSPYSFYQFWLNTADADVVRYLHLFTFLTLDEIRDLAGALERAPQERIAQRALADAMTALVHGAEALTSAQRISNALFSGEPEALTEIDLQQLALDGMETSAILPGTPLLAALAACGLAESRGAARKLVAGKGVRVNGVVQEDETRVFDAAGALHGRYFLVRRGKKNWHLLSLELSTGS